MGEPEHIKNIMGGVMQNIRDRMRDRDVEQRRKLEKRMRRKRTDRAREEVRRLNLIWSM